MGEPVEHESRYNAPSATPYVERICHTEPAARSYGVVQKGKAGRGTRKESVRSAEREGGRRGHTC